MTGTILGGASVEDGEEVKCDVCVIGSGAGGAVVAAGLAEQGLSVVVLEEGGHHTRKDWIALREERSYPMLYQDHGGRSTADRAVNILQGRSVGGSTVVNWATSFRAPEHTLAHWEGRHGVEGWSRSSLQPHYEAVEERLHVMQWPEGAVNENNAALLRGCRALDWEVEVLRRNVLGCVNTGYCGLGCPVDAKQSMHLTYVPDAVASGASVYADCRAQRLEMEAGRVTKVHVVVMERGASRPTGVRWTVKPKVTVCCAGAINGPALLIRSGLTQRGEGRRTWLHPVIAVVGAYDRPIRGWYGAPQSVSSHRFIQRQADQVGFFLEAAPLHPMLVAMSTKQFGPDQEAFLGRLDQSSSLIALHQDGMLPQEEGGHVEVQPDGRVRLHYPMGSALREAFQASHKALSRVHLAAGADQVATLHVDPVLVKGDADLGKLDSAAYGALEHRIFSAHVMGGCPMGGQGEGVVDDRLRHRDVANLFVVDGSVFPTSLGVNPMLTIAAMAHRARVFVGEAV